METKKRSSNLELLRIISMIFIIVHHYAMFANIDISIGQNSLIKYLLISVGKIGVNCFILITGYFMITSNFKFKKLLKLILEVLFYSVAFMLFFYLFKGKTFDKNELFLNFMPIINTVNWFITTYVVLYLLTPVINITLRNLNQKQFIKTIFILILIFSIIPTFFNRLVAFSDLAWFITLYVIAAYIRLYPNKVFDSFKINIFVCILVYIFMVGTIIYGNYMKYSYQDTLFFEDMNKLPLVIVSVCLFLAFRNMKMKHNKFINAVAQSTLGVCLIHENYLFAPILWTKLLSAANLFSYKLLLHCVISIIAVYVLCTVVDKIRFYLLEKPFFYLYDKLEICLKEKIHASNIYKKISELSAKLDAPSSEI